LKEVFFLCFLAEIAKANFFLIKLSSRLHEVASLYVPQTFSILWDKRCTYNLGILHWSFAHDENG
jgi:hypothetical protein